MAEIDTINGWKPPVIYDIGIDQYRIATQADVDRLTAVNQAYGRLRDQARQNEHDHAALMEHCKAIKA